VFASGSNYAVTVKTQPTNPHQTCVASNASGTVVGGAVTNIAVTCTTNTYSVGGSVSGLTGTGLVLQLNGGQDLPMNADGDFVFPTKIASGAQYAVTVKDQSSTYREVCQASNANGTIGGSAISSVTITCTVVSGFVYVTTGMYGDISTYGLQQDGTLTSLGSTVSVGVLPQALVAAPNGKTLYATNFAANTIAAFAVDSSRGTLTTLGSGPLDGSSTGAQSLAILPSGKFLYALNANTRNIHRFSIDATTGALTAAGVVATPSADDSVDIAITPDGAFLYVLARTVAPAATVTAYSIDPVTGALSAGATTSLGRLDRGLVIDPLGRTLYLRRSADPPPPGGPQTTLFPFTIDAGTGALTAVGTGTVAASSGQDFAIDPSGQYAYLLDAFNLTTNNHIDTFAIDASTGALTGIGSSTRVATLPTQIICDPSGRFVFVGSGRYEASNSASTWYDVLGFEIGATGPAAGQLSATGQGTGHVGNYGGGATGQVAVIE
jgi:6-phosphogluconolactonase (cycloisomerase 2 family)